MFSGDKEKVPVVDRTISRNRLNVHYGNSKVAKHFAFWSLISSSLKTDADKRVFFSTKSPVVRWDRVTSFRCAETQGAKLLLSRKVLSARLQPRKDTAIVIGEIVELLAALDEEGKPVHEEFIWLPFVDNLPPGYEFINDNLQGSKKPLTRTVLEDVLRRRYNVQSGGKKGRTIPDSGLFVSGPKAGRGVGRGGGGGGTNKGKLGSRGRSEGLPSQATITCDHCQKPGHIRPNCLERQCFKCQGWGHEAVSCPSKISTAKENGDKNKKGESAVVGVNQVLDSEVTDETKFDENDGGDTTCFIGVELEKDVPPVVELPPQTTVERWATDSECSQFMTPCVDYMVNYREVRGVVRIADGRAMPIEGIGNLPMNFRSGNDWVQVIMPNVANVPLLGYNLLPLRRMADRGPKYVGEKKGVILHLKNRKTLFGPSVGKLNYFSGFRRPLDSSSFALATIAPGKIPSVSPVDINTFHTSHGHAHEKMLRSTAKQLEVVLEGSLRECEGCSVAIGLGKPIGTTTSTRADKVFGRLFVDICGEKSVESIGGKRYMLIICDDFSRFT